LKFQGYDTRSRRGSTRAAVHCAMIPILLVDDEPALLEIAKIFIEREGGYQVTTCSSAFEAMKILENSQFTVIISDYEMPAMDGIEFLKKIRTVGNRTPFIIFTGRGREQVVIEAINYGADFYLQKGGDPKSQFADLRNMIQQAAKRLEAEEAFRRSERQLYEIINFLPDATFAIDREGKIIAWNRAIEEMTGIPASKMLGKGDMEYALPFYGIRRKILIDLLFEKDEDIIRHYYSHIVRNGNGIIAETEISLLRKKPTIVWAKATPFYDEHNNVIGAVESIRDITDLRQYEETIVEGKNRFQELADQLPQGIYEIDLQGSILYADHRTLGIFGYPRDSAYRDYNIFRMLIPEEHSRARQGIRATLETRRIQGNVYTALRKDSTTFPVWIFTAPIVSDDTVTGIRGSIIDLSGIDLADEKVRKYNDIVEATNRKLYLLNSITRHDLQNQLTILNGALELAKTGTADELAEFLAMAEKAAAAMTKTISFTKEYQNIGVSEPIWQSLDDVVHRASESLPTTRVSLDIHVGKVRVFADHLLEKVFYNLFENALRHGGEPLTTIQVLAREDESGLLITVEDDGIGITRKDKEKIFERGIGQNTGLGLFLAREILSITGITLQETGIPGKGARFEICVPRQCCGSIYYEIQGT